MRVRAGRSSNIDTAYVARRERTDLFQNGRQPNLIDLIRGRDGFVEMHDAHQIDVACTVNQGGNRGALPRQRGSAPKVDDPWRCGRYSACYGLKCQQTFLVERCAAAAVIRSLVFFEMVTAAPARVIQGSTRFVRK